MDTLLQQAGDMAKSQIKRVRWMLGLSGALSVTFGVAILIWPNISLYALVLVFGAFALARGIVGLVAAISSPIPQGRGWMILSSLAGIAVGVVVFFYTDMSALALLYVIGAYAIILGLGTIGGAYWLPLEGSSRALLAVTGLISIVFGVVMFAKPGDGAIVLLALIATYAIIVGIAELAVASAWDRLFDRAFQNAVTPPPASPARPKPQASH
jgi:uncharacterized membrane protein HdeD (DUF308 family)